MSRNPTSFKNKAGNGYVEADAFEGPLGRSGHSQPAFISTAQISNLQSTGFSSQAPQLVAAAGATQGNATAITGGVAILVTVTNSAKGAKLPAAVTGRKVEIYNGTAAGCKIYPATSDKIATAATNAAVVLVANKSNIYRAQDAKTWRVLVGA